MSTTHEMPDDLKEPGQAFWTAITGKWELAPNELALLHQAAAQLDLIATLAERIDTEGLTVQKASGMAAHPLLAELRGARAVYGQLWSKLRLPDEDGRIPQNGGRPKGWHPPRKQSRTA